jgi:tRNA(adenine34) deaminase
MEPLNDAHWMNRALELAAEAASMGEIPVGALIVSGDEVIAEAYNRKETDNNPLGHAEILVLQDAAQKLGRWRLTGCTLYVTLEPCVMCAGAIVHSRVDRVVYATPDPKAGAVESIYHVLADARLNHAPVVVSGVLRDEASAQLKEFFKALRERPLFSECLARPGIHAGT